MKKILCVLFLFLMIPAMVFAETEGQETIIEPGVTAEEPIPEEEPPTEQEPVEQEEVLDETPGEENLEEETPEENEEEVPEEVPEEDVEEPSEPPQEEIPEEEIPDEEPQEPEIPEAPQEPEMPEEPEIPEDPIPEDWMPVPFSNRIPETMERLYFSNGDVMKNGYVGNAWLNQYENGYYNGIPQGRYVDHIDIRTGKASITINYHVNGEFRESKTQEAIVTNIKNIKIDGNDLKYISSKSRSDNNEGEFNFQIAPMDDFNYSKWLDLKSVDQITFVCTLTVFDENGNAKNYDNVSMTISGLKNIVEMSVCSNASGLDYYINGSLNNNVIVEIPPEEIDPVIPEPVQHTLVPETGDAQLGTNLIMLGTSGIILYLSNKRKGE